MRVLVVTLPERGHYHPLLGPAAELARRGHDVVWAATSDIRDDLEACGVERSRVLVPPGALPPPSTIRGQALAEILGDPFRLAAWIHELLVEAPARAIDRMRAIVREVKPDVIAIDTMAYDGAIAAHLEGVPWVGWSTSLNPVVDEVRAGTYLVATIDAIAHERAAVFAAHEMSDARFRVSDVLSPRGTAVFATEALVGTMPFADDTIHLVGPSLGGRRGGAIVDTAFADDRPLIYVSFGSQAWFQPVRFTRLVDACDRVGFAMIAAMGDLADTWPAREHVRVAPFVDQLAMLPRATAFVTHGGANSVMEACALGTPMLVAPICNDQPHSAAFVAHARAGVAIDFEFTPDDALDAALVRVATRFVQSCDAIRASYTRDGSVGAADLVERAT